MTVGTSENFLHYLEINPNSTQYSIVWCVDEWDVSLEGNNASLPCHYGEKAQKQGKEMILYTIWYNHSL
jgi:hypothetical protein